MTISEWVEHITGTHHALLKRELPRLRIDLDAAAQGRREPAWAVLAENFRNLKHELEIHLSKEEMMVFPSFRHLEECRVLGQAPDLKRYDIRESLNQMEYEHDATKDFIRGMEGAMVDITDDCRGGALFERMRALCRDLEEHIEKEERGLFPEARFIYSELTKSILREE